MEYHGGEHHTSSKHIFEYHGGEQADLKQAYPMEAHLKQALHIFEHHGEQAHPKKISRNHISQPIHAVPKQSENYSDRKSFLFVPCLEVEVLLYE